MPPANSEQYQRELWCVRPAVAREVHEGTTTFCRDSGRKQPEIVRFVRVGIDRSVQPIALISELNHGLVNGAPCEGASTDRSVRQIQVVQWPGRRGVVGRHPPSGTSAREKEPLSNREIGSSCDRISWDDPKNPRLPTQLE